MHNRIPKVQVNGLPQAHRDSRLFLIACEGEKTEAQYFSFSYLLHSRVKLVVIPSLEGQSSPTHVLENLKKIIKANKEEYGLKSSDQFWLVVDRDCWNLFSQILPVKNRNLEKRKINVAISNPCFELFLYLHFAPMPDHPIKDAAEMEKLLRSVLGSYSKSKLNEDDYRRGYQHAINRSKAVLYDSAQIPVNPGTDVGKLLSEIQACCPKKI